MIRDQYQGGSTMMTAISGVEIAMWDIIGKACGQPVYRLLGGRCQARLPAYANGWYGGCETPGDYAERARAGRGARLPGDEVRPVRHRLEDSSTPERGGARASRSSRRCRGGRAGRRADDRVPRPARRRRRGPLHPTGSTATTSVWCEEPVAPECLDLLREVKERTPPADRGGRAALHAGRFRPADPCAPPTWCRWTSRIAAASRWQEDRRDGRGAGHRRLAALLDRPGGACRGAALRLVDAELLMQESFAEFDVDWRNDLVGGWNPLRRRRVALPDAPGPRPRTRRGGDRRPSLSAPRLPLALGRHLARRIHRHGEAGAHQVAQDDGVSASAIGAVCARGSLPSMMTGLARRGLSPPRRRPALRNASASGASMIPNRVR